jgi:hypothetical protein
MRKDSSHGLVALILLLIGVGALAGLRVVSPSPTFAQPGDTSSTIARAMDPVIVTGEALEAIAGAPVDHVYVYAYDGEEWSQIPFQVDEVTEEGAYVAEEDGLLDANDEVVFMAADLGEQTDSVPPGLPITGEPVSWYELQVGDPLDDEQAGWAYLVVSEDLAREFNENYVTYNAALQRIEGSTYTIGLATTHPGFDHLTVGDSDINILDRTKARVRVGNLTLTEEDLEPTPPGLVKDGPVRVILRDGASAAYASLLDWQITVNFRVPIVPIGVRFSTDFRPEVAGATLYNAAVPEGVLVDGVPDEVPPLPRSPWWQLVAATGTVIQVSDPAPIGGEQINYYVDDSTIDPEDTGDQRRYGDVGIISRNANRSFTYDYNMYFSPDQLPNVGAQYQSYYTTPLTVTATRLEAAPTPVIYLPVVFR